MTDEELLALKLKAQAGEFVPGRMGLCALMLDIWNFQGPVRASNHARYERRRFRYLRWHWKRLYRKWRFRWRRP